MSLDEQDQLKKELNNFRNDFEKLDKRFKELENNYARKRTKLEKTIDELNNQLEKYSKHDAVVDDLDQIIREKNEEILIG